MFRQRLSLFGLLSLLFVALGLTGCTSLALPPNSLAYPTATPLSFTAEEQSAIDIALASLGDKAQYLGVAYVTTYPPGGHEARYRVTFHQIYQGVRVLRSGLNIYVYADGTTSQEGGLTPTITFPNTAPVISLDQAAQLAAARTGMTGDYFFDRWETPELVIYPASEAGGKGYVLAWRFTIRFATCTEGGWPFFVNAVDGSLLWGKYAWDGDTDRYTPTPPCVLFTPLPTLTDAPYTHISPTYTPIPTLDGYLEP